MQTPHQQVTPFLPTRYNGCLALHLDMRIPLDMLVQHVTHSVVTMCLSADPSFFAVFAVTEPCLHPALNVQVLYRLVAKESDRSPPLPGDGKDRRRNEAESMRPAYMHWAGQKIDWSRGETSGSRRYDKIVY